MRSHEGLFAGIFGRGGAGTGDEAWLQAMLDAEAALARALERAGLAEPGAGAEVTAAARAAAFDAAELGRQAALTGNPVPPLVRALTAAVPPWAAGAVHHGATSQDILDTAAMLVARDALTAVLADLAAAATAAAGLAAAHRDTIMIGRTLLQQAVPVTFGLVAAGWLTAIDEARLGLARVRGERLAVQFGGAAGTLAALGDAGPRVSALLAGELGLAAAVLPWHTDRLRILDLAAALAAASAALGKIARDVTLLAQSEVAEVREGGAGAAAARRRCRTSATRWPRWRYSAAPAGCPACSRPWPLPPSRNTSAPRVPGTRSGSRSTTCSRLTGSASSWGAELLAGLVVDAGRMRANLDAGRRVPAGRARGRAAGAAPRAPARRTTWSRRQARTRPPAAPRSVTHSRRARRPRLSPPRGSARTRSTPRSTRPATWVRPPRSPTPPWPRTTSSRRA